jgi:hypothetical protein
MSATDARFAAQTPALLGMRLRQLPDHDTPMNRPKSGREHTEVDDTKVPTSVTP